MTARRDAAGREQDIKARARAQVEDGLARPQLGEHCRIAASETDRLGQPDLLQGLSGVRAAAPAVGSIGLAAAGRPRTGPVEHDELLGDVRVAQADGFPDFTHGVISLAHR